jgi:hypothetical protein
VSTGGIIAIVVVGLLGTGAVSLRVAVAKQRRQVAAARARLASARVRRRADDVSVEVLQQVGASFAHVARKATCALADDGFYCFSGDGAWGARVRFAPGAPEPGDITLAAPPALVKGGVAVDADVPAWLVAALASLPPDALLLQFPIGLTWLIAVPEVDAWFAALKQAIGGPGAAATT